MSFCCMLTKENLFSKYCISADCVSNGRDTTIQEPVSNLHVQWIHLAQSILETKRTELSRPEKWERTGNLRELRLRRAWRELLLNRQERKATLTLIDILLCSMLAWAYQTTQILTGSWCLSLLIWRGTEAYWALVLIDVKNMLIRMLISQLSYYFFRWLSPLIILYI